MDDKNYTGEEVCGMPWERTRFDSLRPPLDIIQMKAVQIEDLPFWAISIGKYREGKNFLYSGEGFDTYSFTLMISGSKEVTYRSSTVKIERGDMVFTSTNPRITNRSIADDSEFWFVNIGGAYCHRFEELWNEGGLEVIRARDVRKYAEIIDRIADEINRPYLSSELTINSLITQLLTDALGEKYDTRQGASDKLYPSWINEAAQYISSRCEQDIRISELAARFYMNCNTFSRNFKKYMKQTPKEYQTACRVKRASALLGNADMSIVDIACRCGFSSQSFFTKIFRTAYGVTPAKYRANLLKTLQ